MKRVCFFAALVANSAAVRVAHSPALLRGEQHSRRRAIGAAGSAADAAAAPVSSGCRRNASRA